MFSWQFIMIAVISFFAGISLIVEKLQGKGSSSWTLGAIIAASITTWITITIPSVIVAIWLW